MNVMEKAMWGTAFAQHFGRHRDVKSASMWADRVVMEARWYRWDDGTEDGAFHSTEELELERKAELDLPVGEKP